MKQKAAFLVVAFALLVAIVMSGHSYVNTAVTGVNHPAGSSGLFTSDGGYPTPPIPPPTNPPSGQLSPPSTPIADGGYPTPPIPPPTNPSGQAGDVSVLAL